MPKKKLSLAERKPLLEETKQRLRLEQEARTIARIEQLEIEAVKTASITTFRVLAGYSLSIDDDNKRITKKNERIMAKICQV